jgi:diguanylate cyclase (GGDEF)-like protein
LENKTYTLSEIVEKSNQDLFSPLHKDQSKFGFTDSIFWIKVHSINSSSIEKTQILELNHPSLDTIDIYELKDQGLILKKELGDLRVYDKSTFMPNPNYEFTVSPKQEKVFFIQIISTGTLNIGMSVQDVNAYNLYSSAQVKWLSFYFGAVLIMLMYNFIIYLIIKNRIFLYYVLSHMTYLLFALSLSGISFELFWPDTPDINRYVLPITMPLTGTFSLLFAIHFLNIKLISNTLYKFLFALMIISFIVSLLPFITGYSVAIKLGSLLTFIIAITLFIVSLYLAIFKTNINALFYFVAWSFFCVGVVISHLSNIGLVPSTILTNFSSQIGSFFEVLLLSIALAYSYNRLQNEHRKLTYSNDRLRVLSHTDMLTGSYNRRYFHDKVNVLLSIAKDENSDFYLLMLDLDHFKKINDTYGHDIGDKVLISFATICRKILRENDIFARLGGEEFVLCLPDTDETTAIHIAKRINTAIRNSTFDFAPDLNLTVSIGISHNTFELEKLLDEADKALYKAKSSGRNTFVLYKS